jgi:hydrogenase maturation protease
MKITMKKASIIGLGDISKGDLGVGCYIIEAFEQERLNDSIHLAYLAEDPRYAGAFFYEMNFAVIVGALNLEGAPGDIHCWSYKTFHKNTGWLVNEFPSIRLLIDTLTWIELAGKSPEELLFLWIEPKIKDGFGISKEVCKALRKTIQIIKKNFFERGFLPEYALEILPIYRLKLLGTVV